MRFLQVRYRGPKTELEISALAILSGMLQCSMEAILG